MVNLQVGTEKILFTELPEIIPFSFGKETVNQGDFAQLTCVVTRGDKPLSITWSLKGDIISSGPTLTTTMLGTQTSILMISSVDYHHSGVYTCRAENPAGISSHSAELLVNGKTTGWHWIYSIYRKTWDCSFLLWIWHDRPRKICPACLCHKSWWYANLHHLESEGRHYKFWPNPDHDNAWNSNQHFDDILCWLSSQWCLYL